MIESNFKEKVGTAMARRGARRIVRGVLCGTNAGRACLLAVWGSATASGSPRRTTSSRSSTSTGARCAPAAHARQRGGRPSARACRRTRASCSPGSSARLPSRGPAGRVRPADGIERLRLCCVGPAQPRHAAVGGLQVYPDGPGPVQHPAEQRARAEQRRPRGAPAAVLAGQRQRRGVHPAQATRRPRLGPREHAHHARPHAQRQPRRRAAASAQVATGHGRARCVRPRSRQPAPGAQTAP